MRTQIYEHRSGLKVVPRDIVSDVEKFYGISILFYQRERLQASKSLCEKDWKKRGGQVNIAWIHPLELQFRLI